MEQLAHLREPLPKELLDKLTKPARTILGLALAVDLALVVVRVAGGRVPALLAGVAAALTIATLPSVLGRFLDDFGGWVYVTAVCLGIAAGVVIYLVVESGQGSLLTGELGPDTEVEHHFLSESPGDRIVATLTTNGDLEADMSLLGASDAPVRSHQVEGSDERRVDVTIPGGDFTIAVRHVSGSGRDEVSLSVDGGTRLTPEQMDSVVIERTIAVPADSDGYAFELSASQAVEIALGSVSGDGFRAHIASAGGFVKGVIAQADPATPVVASFNLPAGRYVLIVGVATGTGGTYRLGLGGGDIALSPPARPTPVPTTVVEPTSPTTATPTPGQDTTPTPTPQTDATPTPSDLLVVPDVFGLPLADGIAILTEAGFEVQVIPVCSNSVSSGLVRQVFTYDATGSIELPVVDKEGRIDDGEDLRPSGDQLYVKEVVGTC